MSEVLVLVNPTAGGGRAGPVWERIEPLARRLADVEAVVSGDRRQATAAIESAVAAGARRVVVVGGDGSVHLAANALLRIGRAGDVVLGLVPAGTGSDLARVLHVQRRAEDALREALAGPARSLDAGRCQTAGAEFYFCNIASIGVSGLVDAMVNANPKRGRTAFLGATLRALRSYRCLPLRVAVDEAAWHEGAVFLLAVANGSTFGKGMRIAPHARPDDGLFEIVLVGEVAGWGLVRRLPQVYLGRHLGAPQVRVTRGRDVAIEPMAGFPPFDVDGETYPSGAARFTLLHGALRFAGGKDA